MRKETCPIFGSQDSQKSLNGSILKNDPKNVSARNFKDHNSESKLRFKIFLGIDWLNCMTKTELNETFSITMIYNLSSINIYNATLF